MNSQKAQTIQEMFSRIAPTYDLLNRSLSANIDQIWRKKAIAYLPKIENLKVLDLCAGTLDLTLAILKKYPGSEITSLDFSAKMLELGEKKIPSSDRSRVKIEVGDAMDLKFSDGSFDAVICGFGMRNVVDNFKSLSEIYRVLKPNGKTIILEFFKPQSWQSKLFHATFGSKIIPWFGGLISKDKEAYQYLFNSIQNYHSIENFIQIAKQAEFKNIHTQHLTAHIASIVVGEK